MKRTVLLLAVWVIVLSAFAGDALAQRYGRTKKGGSFEITPFAGYTFSTGVEIEPDEFNPDEFIDEVTPVSGFSYGLAADYFFGREQQFGVGFQFSEQDSALEIGFVGGGREEIADMKVRNYHGVFTVQFLDGDNAVRPFIYVGLGATQFAPGNYQDVEIDGETKFSSTFGGGVKVYFNEHLGARLLARWTPTYIYSETDGIWCHPYWGCWEYGEAKYTHQFELSAGMILRF